MDSLVNHEWKRTRSAIKELEDLLVCGVCTQIVENPCTLGGCEHFFCRKCIHDYAGNACPVCNIPSHVKDTVVNRQLANTVQWCRRLRRLVERDSQQSSKISDKDITKIIEDAEHDFDLDEDEYGEMELSGVENICENENSKSRPYMNKNKSELCQGTENEVHSKSKLLTENTSENKNKTKHKPCYSREGTKSKENSDDPLSVFDFVESPNSSKSSTKPVARRTRKAAKELNRKQNLAKMNKNWGINGASPGISPSQSYTIPCNSCRKVRHTRNRRVTLISPASQTALEKENHAKNKIDDIHENECIHVSDNHVTDNYVSDYHISDMCRQKDSDQSRNLTTNEDEENTAALLKEINNVSIATDKQDEDTEMEVDESVITLKPVKENGRRMPRRLMKTVRVTVSKNKNNKKQKLVCHLDESHGEGKPKPTSQTTKPTPQTTKPTPQTTKPTPQTTKPTPQTTLDGFAHNPSTRIATRRKSGENSTKSTGKASPQNTPQSVRRQKRKLQPSTCTPPRGASFSILSPTPLAHSPTSFGRSPTSWTGSPALIGSVRSPATPTPSYMKKNAKGETPLHVAAIKGDENKVSDLLKQGANPNTKDNAGWTPLHEACNHGNVKIASMLIQSGAFINMPGLDNETPLHDAVQNNRVEIVKLLVGAGAALDVRNSRGLTPWDYAKTDVLSAALDTPVSSTQLASSPVQQSQVPKYNQIVLLTTGLKREQKIQVEKCTKMIDAKLATDFSHDVTHVVTSVNKDGMCPRTMKYLQAVALGKWIVSYDWISVCLEYGQKVCEDAFEVPGSSTNPDSQAPMKARQNTEKQLPGLFDGCQFYFQGSFDYPTPPKDELIALVKSCGGTVLTREPKADSWSEDLTVPYHANQGSKLRNCCFYVISNDTKKKLNSKCNNGASICTQPGTWIMDCIATFELLDEPLT